MEFEKLTKQELINYFSKLIKRLIEQNKIKSYPFKKPLKYFDKKTLIEGIKIYIEK